MQRILKICLLFLIGSGAVTSSVAAQDDLRDTASTPVLPTLPYQSTSRAEKSNFSLPQIERETLDQQRPTSSPMRRDRLVTGRDNLANPNVTRTNPNPDAYASQQLLAVAKTDEQKKDAKEKLSKALDREFEADVARRRSELDAIKERLATMEALLKKRVDGKEEIVALRLQVMLNNASGLGWPEQPSRGFGFQRQLHSYPVIQNPQPDGRYTETPRNE